MDLDALSSLAIVLLRTVELVALVFCCGCLCSVSSSLPHCAVCWSAVCDCGIS